MNCPRCLTPLAAANHDAVGVTVDTVACAECDGHWLEQEALRHVEEAVDVRMVKWRRLPGAETQAAALFCPRCRPERIMDKVLSERDQRVVMDVCPACHGIWLDGGELEAIEQKGLLSALLDLVRVSARGRT